MDRRNGDTTTAFPIYRQASDDETMTSSLRFDNTLITVPPTRGGRGVLGNCSGVTTTSGLQGILELRKEKSRDAARWRRGKENAEFYELARLLPLPSAITGQLDKASVVRLAVSYLKLIQFCADNLRSAGIGYPPPQQVSRTTTVAAAPKLIDEVFDKNHGTHVLQVEMTGSSIFDYVYRHDQQELIERLRLKPPTSLCFTTVNTQSQIRSPNSPDTDISTDSNEPTTTAAPPDDVIDAVECSLCVRMKSTLTKRGLHLKSAGYRVVQLVARSRQTYDSPSPSSSSCRTSSGLCVTAISLPLPTLTEFILDASSFVVKMLPDLTVLYCESRRTLLLNLSCRNRLNAVNGDTRLQKLCELTSLSPDDVINRNLYDLCHVVDLSILRHAHVDVLNKGQCLSDYWRLMDRRSGYVWTQIRATLTSNTRNIDDQHIVAIVYVLSRPEFADHVFSVDQMVPDCTTIAAAPAIPPVDVFQISARQATRQLSCANDAGSIAHNNNVSVVRKLSTSYTNTNNYDMQSCDGQDDHRFQTAAAHGVTSTRFRNWSSRTQPFDCYNACRINQAKNRAENTSPSLSAANDSNYESHPLVVESSPSLMTSSFTVFDLERAMNRHLPPASSPEEATHAEPTGNSATTAAVWSVCWMTATHQRRRHVINTPAMASSSAPPSPNLLPASTLLRSLHDAALMRSRRQSVIRSVSGSNSISCYGNGHLNDEQVDAGLVNGNGEVTDNDFEVDQNHHALTKYDVYRPAENCVREVHLNEENLCLSGDMTISGGHVISDCRISSLNHVDEASDLQWLPLSSVIASDPYQHQQLMTSTCGSVSLNHHAWNDVSAK